MNSNATNILLRNNYIPIPLCNDKTSEVASCEAIATVMMNLSYYGFALSTEGYRSCLFWRPDHSEWQGCTDD